MWKLTLGYDIHFWPFTRGMQQGGVSHCGLAIYIKKDLKAKEEVWKLKYFTMQKSKLKTNPLQGILIVA